MFHTVFFTFLLLVTTVSSLAPSNSLCSISSLNSFVSNNAAIIDSYFESPKASLQQLVNQLLAMRSDTQYTNQFQFLSVYSNGAEWDNSTTRVTEWLQGPLSMRNYYENDSCVFLGGSPDNCLYQRNNSLTVLCAEPLYQITYQCPDPDLALSVPYTEAQWLRTKPMNTCPYYCLNPSRYENSFNQYIFETSYPLNYLVPTVYNALSIETMSFIGINGAVRDYPSLYPCTFLGCTLHYGDIFPILPNVYVSGPAHSSNRLPHYSTPFYSAVNSLVYTAVSVPIYDQNDYQGQLIATINVNATQTILSSLPTTANSFTMVVNLNTGGIIAATQHAYNLMFCPEYCNSTLNNGDYDFETKLALNPLGLFNSPYGFKELVSQLLSLSPSSSNSLQLTQVPLSANNISHYVLFSPINLPPANAVMIVAAPTTDIDQAAVVSLIPENLNLIQPETAAIVNSHVDVLAYANDLDAPYTFQLVNQGILDMNYTISTLYPWIAVYESTFVGDKVGIPTSGQQILMSGSYSRQIAQENSLSSSSTFIVQVDWSRVDMSVNNEPLIIITPNPRSNDAGCFGNLYLTLNFQLVSELTPVINSSMAVLGFVVSVFGCWTSLILIEQAIHDYQIRIQQLKNSYMRKNKFHSLKVLVFSTSASAAALSFCAMFSSIYISQSQVSVSNSYFQIQFSGPIAITSLLPIFTLVLLAFFVLLHRTAALIQVNAIKQISATSQDSSLTKSHLTENTIDEDGKEEAKERASDQSEEEEEEIASDVHSKSNIFTVSNVFSFTLASFTLLFAFFVGHLMLRFSLVSNCDLVYKYNNIAVAVIFGWLLISIGLAFFFYLLRFQYRWCGAFIMAGGFTLINQLSVSAIQFQLPQSPIPLPPGNYITNETLVIISISISVVTCFLLMGLQFTRMKLSRVKLNLLLTRLRTTLQKQTKVNTDLRREIQHLQFGINCTQLLRPMYNSSLAAALLAQSEYTVHKLCQNPNVKNGKVNLESAQLVVLKQLESKLSPLFQAFSNNQIKNNPPVNRLGDSEFLPFDSILNNNITVELFKDACQSSLCVENVQFYLLVNYYRKAIHFFFNINNSNAFLEIFAESIVENYIKAGSINQVNISANQRDEIISKTKKKSFPVSLFDIAQKEVYSLLLSNNYRLFLQKPQYLLCVEIISLQEKTATIDNDSVVQKLSGIMNRNDDRMIKSKLSLTGSSYESKLPEENPTPLPNVVN